MGGTRSRAWVRGLAAAALLGAWLTASASGAACTVGKLAELPVTMVGLRAMVPAGIEGHDRTFIVDSGAFYSMITPGAAAELHLPLRSLPPYFTVSGVGGDTYVQLTTVRRFRLVGADIPNVDFLVGNIGADSGSSGIIGQNVLGLADVEYDLEHGAIRLMRSRGCDHTNMAYWAGARPYSIAKLAWLAGPTKFTVVTVEVNGVKVRALLDSGAAVSALSLDAARRAGIRTDGPDVKPAGVSSGIGRRTMRTWIAPVKSFKIGDEEIQNTHLRFTDLNLSTADMLLGADFLLSHRVFVETSQDQMFFTYDGGPVFNLEAAKARDDTPPPPAGAPAAPAGPSGQAPETPTDAAGFERRAAAFAARREYASAADDYSKALALAPDDADAYFGRALARAELSQPFLAMADLDSALKLRPQDVRAHVVRAELRLRGHDRDGAKADVDAASTAAAKEADVRLRLGELYADLDDYPDAIAQYDLWTVQHGEDARLRVGLANRCWARAMANRDLDRAMSDCNRAVSLAPTAAVPRGDRGIVELRRGDDARALADLDAAVKMAPKGAWWLYGRGLAELRAGQADAGRADLAAAAALAPKLADRAKAVGLAPPP